MNKISDRANTEFKMWTETLSQARGGGRVSSRAQTIENSIVPLKGVAKVADEESKAQKAMVTTKAEEAFSEVTLHE